MERERLLVELGALIRDDPEAVETILDYIRQRDGGVGLMYRVLSRRPEVLVPRALQGVQIYDRPRAVDPKTAELAAVAAAAALRCEPCLDAHLRAAHRKGASSDELLDVLLVAGAIAESSTWAVAFRQLRRMEGQTQGEE